MSLLAFLSSPRGVQAGVTFPGSLTLPVAVASWGLVSAAGAPLEKGFAAALAPQPGCGGSWGVQRVYRSYFAQHCTEGPLAKAGPQTRLLSGRGVHA